MYPTETLIKTSQKKKVHKQIHAKFGCSEKQFAPAKTDIKNKAFENEVCSYFLDVHGKISDHFMA